jgi:hypothetical protein
MDMGIAGNTDKLMPALLLEGDNYSVKSLLFREANRAGVGELFSHWNTDPVIA